MTSGPDPAAPPVDFAGLYRDHAADVHRFALYLSGDRALAEALGSDAFTRVWTARDRVELSTVRGYLFAIVRNLFLQHLRRERRRAPLQDAIETTEAGPEDRASGQSSLRAVLAALGTLSEVARRAVLMRAAQEVPQKAIASHLGSSTTAAKVKV